MQKESKLSSQIIEYKEFSRTSAKLLGKEEGDLILEYIGMNPKVGALVDNTGGIRHLSWPLDSKHRSDNKGTIYYYYKDRSLPIFLISVFKPGAKNTLGRTIEILLARN